MNDPRYRLDPRIDPVETETLRRELDQAGWSPTEGDDWTFSWSNAVHDLAVFADLDDHKMVNHFPGVGPLFYKDELAHFLAEAGHTFHPPTFSLPWHHDAWLQARAEAPETLWLLKQKRWMAGDGMRIITDDAMVPTGPEAAEWLIQRYVANPYLLPDHPYKHVLRSYVVVTSLDPLVAFIHPNGPVKFTSRPFSLDQAALQDPVVHLTNPAVQRLNTDTDDPVRGMDHDDYRIRLRDIGIDADEVFDRIDTMLADTLRALHEPVLSLSRQWAPRLDRSFELLGFDLMLDDELEPWLLECNISPALGVRGREGSPHREAQRRAKEPMLADMLRLVGLVPGTHRFRALVS